MKSLRKKKSVAIAGFQNQGENYGQCSPRNLGRLENMKKINKKSKRIKKKNNHKGI